MRILQWIIGVLVLCNIGLMSFIWLRPHAGGPPPGETPRDYVIRSLGFTADQVKKYDALIKDHHSRMQQLKHEADGYRHALFANLNTAQPGNTADSLSTLIGNTQKTIEKVTYDHFAQVRALCTEAQQKEFDNIIEDLTKRMSGPPHPPRGGRPGHPGGPPPLPGDDGPPPPDGPQNP